jgi:hypothetical protein
MKALIEMTNLDDGFCMVYYVQKYATTEECTERMRLATDLQF